jgi:hypothetical protein
LFLYIFSIKKINTLEEELISTHTCIAMASSSSPNGPQPLTMTTLPPRLVKEGLVFKRGKKI